MHHFQNFWLKRNGSIFCVLILLCSEGAFGDRLVLDAPKSCSQIFQQFYSFLERGDTPSLQSVEECSVAHTLLTWFWLIKQDSQATLDEYRQFMIRHPHWPQMKKIQERGESRIVFATDSSEVLSFFKTKEPITSGGMIHYVRALFISHQKQEAIRYLRKFWVFGNFTASNEKFFYDSFKQHLMPSDHEQRLDRLMMEGNIYGLKRMLPLLSKENKQLVEATLMLIENNRMADFFVRKLTRQSLNRQGLTYQRIKWRLNKGKKQEAVDLFLEKHQEHFIQGWAPFWFKHRYYCARFLFKKKQYAKAYHILKGHGLNPFDASLLKDYAAAEWFLGWISLKFLGNSRQAFKHFQNMHHHVKTPMSQAKAWYWMGQAELCCGREEEAHQWLQKAASFSHVFYGQEALKALGRPLVLALRHGPTQQGLSFQTKELEEAALLLYKTNSEDPHLQSFLLHIARTCKPGEQEQFIHWLKMNGLTRWLVLCTKIVGRKGPVALKQAFPKHDFDPSLYHSPHLTPILLHALVRQESGFDVGITSPAGASGLMQIMPHMAERFCKALKIPFHPQKLTSDANYNIRLGTHFLKSLLIKFQGNLLLTLAAYNAGEPWVQEWIKDYGDPRHPDMDPLHWLESIPFSETRSYIMRILESMPFYELRLSDG